MARRVEGITEQMSVRDAARALGVHENTIRNWIKSGRLDAITLPGSNYRRVSGESVRRVLDENIPSYHDLHVTTETMPRTSIFDLPYGYEVSCNRVAGWSLWFEGGPDQLDPDLVAGEYHDWGLRLDVAGHVIVDSIKSARAFRESEEATA